MSSAQEIKTVALRLFTQNGYEGTSLSEIANGVGITKSSIYAHYKGKEHLFLAVFDDALWDYNNHVEQMTKEIKHDSVEQQLYKILADICSYYHNSEEKVVFLKRAMLFPPAFLQEELREKFATSEKALLQMLYSIFEEGIEDGIIREEKTANLLGSYLCVLDGLFSHMVYYGMEGFEERLQSIWKIFWGGIQVV